MHLNQLERLLARIPAHPAPRAELEQYATPADLAAPLLFEAQALGDITGRTVADLGCGTGVFAIGAALLGAAGVVGLDVDEASIAVAAQEAARAGVDVEWRVADIKTWDERVDTVLMNPPFGAQVRHADRPFLDAALRTADAIYTLHNANTRDFVEGHATTAGFETTHRWRLRFPLKHQYRHQTKAVQEVDVVALRLQRTRTSRVERGLADAVASSQRLAGYFG